MEAEVLNLDQAIEFLGVSEKTLIKLLREEHVPARKIGREWRFSREALINWLASGDSINYINLNEMYMVSEDRAGNTGQLMEQIGTALSELQANGNNIRTLLEQLDRDIVIPQDAALRISYKQKRDVEKLEFKLFWNQREAARLEPNQKPLLLNR